MRTIKYADIGNLTTEQHNLEISNIKEINEFGQTLRIYEPCNLNIFITNKCHNNCDFCINKTNEKCVNIDDTTYLLRLKSILEKLKGINIEATITGGEPTINKSLLVNTLRLLHQYHIHCRTFSTTGKFLLDAIYEKPIVQHLIETDFIHNISISRMCFDEDMNDSILHGQNISNKELEKLQTFFRLNDAEMRISCNLIPGCVDSYDRAIDTVRGFNKIGIETVMFRELEKVAPYIPIDKITEVIKNNKNYTYLKTLKGLAYIVDIYKYYDKQLDKEFIVKVYNNNPEIDKSITFSLSYNNGILRKGFSGHILEI